MPKLKLDVEALQVQSFATVRRSHDGGTVLGHDGYSVDFRCVPSIDICYTHGCAPSQGCGTDWDTCARSCQTCEGQETCVPEP